MRLAALIAASILAAGCGRIGYDSLTGAQGDDAGPITLCSAELSAGAPYAGGSGTADDPFQICTTTQLGALTTRVDDLGASFVLMADLDFTDFPFPGIGSTNTPFTGEFEGKNLSIRHLTITGSAGEPLGFINVAQGARIQNLRLESLKVAGNGSEEVGGLIGKCKLSQALNITLSAAEIRGDASVGGLVGSLSQCQIVGATISVIVSGANNSVGGVAGDSDYSLILNVDAEVDVNAPLAISVGGIVGVEGGDSVRMQRVHVKGSVVGKEAVGGLLGYNGDGAYIYLSSFTGSVRGEVAVGGIVGENYDIPFEVYSTSVAADIFGNQHLGGFSGRQYYVSKFFDSSFTGTISGEGANQAGLGGFFGDVEYGGWVERSYVNVSIKSQATQVGGFIGHLGYFAGATLADIVNSFSATSLTGLSPTDTISPFVGETTEGYSLPAGGSYQYSVGCENLGDGNCGNGGTPLANIADLQEETSAPLSSWDFVNVWKAEPGAFPSLRLEQIHTPLVTQSCPNDAIVGLDYDCGITISDEDKNEGQFLVREGSLASCPWLSFNLYSTLGYGGTPSAEDPSSCVLRFVATDGVHQSTAEEIAIEVHLGVLTTPTANSYAGWDLGSFPVGGAGAVELFTLTNNELVAVSDLSVAGLPAGDFAFEDGTYPGTGGDCSSTLGPGQTCTVAIRYLPTVLQSVSEKISINFTAERGPVTYVFTLNGYGGA